MKTDWDFTQPLLTAGEREVALKDMRERCGYGDSEQEPSLDDCIYIGAVYQKEKTDLLNHPSIKVT